MALPQGYRIETVRGRIDEDLAQDLVSFWTGHGVLGPEAARERLEDVVCVLFDADNRVAGVNSVQAQKIPMIGNRLLWLYRMFLPPASVSPAVGEAMIKAAREHLEQGFTGAEGEPLGLCVLVTSREMMERYPQAVWPGTGLLFAGYTPEGVQVRLGWFEGARI